MTTTRPTLGSAPIHRTLHQAGPSTPLGRSLAGLDAYQAILDKLAALDTVRPAQITGAAASIDELVLAAANAGSGLTSAIEKRIFEAAVAADLPKLVAESIQRLRERFTGELDACLDANANKILQDLHEQLQDVLARGREAIAAIGDAASFEEAHAHGAADDFTAARECAQEYTAIRTAQRAIVGAFDPETNMSPTDYLFRFAEPRVDGDFVARELNVNIVDAHGQVRRPEPAKWPDDLDGPEAFEWLASNPDARPWVPTLREVRELRARIGDLLHKANGSLTSIENVAYFADTKASAA